MLARLQARPERIVWLAGVLLVLIWLLVYLTTVSPTVNFIDSGELITALQEPGIAHPPGYPLYVLLGYVASHLLWGDMAWRVNVLSAFWGAMAVGAFYFLIYRCSVYIHSGRTGKTQGGSSKASQRVQNSNVDSKKTGRSGATPQAAQPTPTPTLASFPYLLFIASSAAGASLLAASSTFWSRTAQAKMYTLHFFFIAILLTLALQYRSAYERGDKSAANRWLIAVAVTLGLSFTNHLMTILLVLPVALVLVGGNDITARIRAILKRWLYVLPCAVVPLLLYAYLPLRASQDPTMNWGSPDSVGDFWRHITGWQYQIYLGANFSQNVGLISRYAFEQWSLLTIPVFLAGLAGAVLLFRAKIAIFWATFALLVLTLIFSTIYGISEIEPYMVGAYAMIVVWIGLAPASWLALAATRKVVPITRSTRQAAEIEASDAASRSQTQQQAWAIITLTAVVMLGSAIMIYPKQNYSQNRLAEQFDRNVFADLPQNSILLTDYWDFYSPTYYLQIVQNVRPDLMLIDESLLKYPWYTQQLTKRYPAFIAKSQDIATKFTTEQRKWINGDLSNGNVLDQYYYDLMTSFVERNVAAHSVFMLTVSPCSPETATSVCPDNRIAPTYIRVPYGLAFKLVPPDTAEAPVPAEPDYKTEGITTNQVGFDDAGRTNSLFYVDAYNRLSAYFNALSQTDAAQRMADKASAIRTAIGNR